MKKYIFPSVCALLAGVAATIVVISLNYTVTSTAKGHDDIPSVVSDELPGLPPQIRGGYSIQSVSTAGDVVFVSYSKRATGPAQTESIEEFLDRVVSAAPIFPDGID